jgi:hypothetical protein
MNQRPRTELKHTGWHVPELLAMFARALLCGEKPNHPQVEPAGF